MANDKRRTIRIDRRVQARINGEHKQQAMKAKEASMDEAISAPVPKNDGIDHMRWPAEARKLALLLVDPTTASLSQKELGELCGYSLRSVSRYLGDPDFKAYVNSLMNRVFDDEADTHFRRNLLDGLKRGEFKHLELYAKMKGMLKNVTKVESDVNINDNRSKVDADDQAEIERLRREVGINKDGEVTH